MLIVLGYARYHPSIGADEWRAQVNGGYTAFEVVEIHHAAFVLIAGSTFVDGFGVARFQCRRFGGKRNRGLFFGRIQWQLVHKVSEPGGIVAVIDIETKNAVVDGVIADVYLLSIGPLEQTQVSATEGQVLV